MLRYFCNQNVRRLVKKHQMFLSYSEKLEERVLCTPVIFFPSKFIVQHIE